MSLNFFALGLAIALALILISVTVSSGLGRVIKRRDTQILRKDDKS